MNPVNYFRQVREEINKIVWPTREQTIRYTILVITVSVGTGIFLGGLDYFLTFLTSKLLGA